MITIFLILYQLNNYKKIINIGRGPQEISIVRTYYYYEKKDLLFINDHFNNVNKILCYDIKSQTFLSPIKKCFTNQWDNFIIFNDSLISGSLYDMDAESNPYAIFFQDFKGNFMSGIKSKRNVINGRNQRELLQRMFFYYGDHKIHVKYIYDDTLFVLDDNKLSPYLITQYNSPQSDPPLMNLKIGEKRSYFERFENSSFIIFRNETYKGMIPFKPGAQKADYEIVYFLVNKSNGNYGIIKSFTDDFIGSIQTSEGETMTFPKSLPNNKLYVLYYPNELLKRTSAYQLSKRYPESVISQLNNIKRDLSETDNPVLLIGIPKKKI